MSTKSLLGALLIAGVSATCFAQGLTDPYRFHSRGTRFHGRAPDELNLDRDFRRTDFDGRPPLDLLNIFPGRRFNFPPQVIDGDDTGVVGNGTVVIGDGDHDHVFDPVSGSFDFLRPSRTFGYNAYASATGVGNRAAGIGTGVGNKFAGLGAYYYGQGAGLGMFASGMGDFYAGQGRYLEGEGTYNQLNSIANINNEEAEYRDLKNDEYTASAFFNKRKINMEARRYEQDMQRYAVDRLSNEQIAKLQKMRVPERLGFQQFDEVTGALAWPALLNDPLFAASREELNRLFALRAKLGAHTGLGSENYREIRLATQRLENDLREAMSEMAPMEYTTAKNFLRSLDFEAQQPMAKAFPIARVADAR